MEQFWKYSGIVLWIVLGSSIILRLIFGKDWLTKLGIKLFLGNRLDNSLKKLIKESRDRNVSDDTLANVTAGIVWRLTRIGMVGLLIASVPLILLYQQNKLIRLQNGLFLNQNRLFESQNAKIDTQTNLLTVQTGLFQGQNEKLDTQNVLFSFQNENVATQTRLLGDQNRLVGFQNTRIDSQINLMSYQNVLLDTQNYRINLQNNLIEAERRGSLVILMSNIMDQMNEEINEQKKGLSKDSLAVLDSLGYRLSDPLIGRIAALSQGFLPYRYLEGDTLIETPTSPERGQLLLSLVKSNLDSVSYR